MKSPWLSVIMPTYNGAAYLPAALESIRAQRDEALEVIALDDGSSDATLATLDSYARRLPLQIIRRGRVGNWVANTNHGLEIARGEYVCFLHQDDLWLAGRLAILKGLLARCPEATLVLHPSWYIDDRGKRAGLWRCPLPSGDRILPSRLVVERLLVQNFIAMPAPLFRRELALRVGGMNERLWYTADWDFWLKLAAAGKTVYWPQALTDYRIHPHSQTLLRSLRADDFRRQLQLVLDTHLQVWEGLHPGRPAVGRVARFSLEVNWTLAACVHGQRPDLAKLALRFLALGPAGWHRYLRDSRIVERVTARLRKGVWPGTSGPAPPGASKSRAPARRVGAARVTPAVPAH